MVEPASGVRRSPAVDTFAGRVHVEWAPEEAATPLGQLPFFIDYLKQAGLFEPWVADCPLDYTSPNAPAKRDLLGTLMLAFRAPRPEGAGAGGGRRLAAPAPGLRGAAAAGGAVDPGRRQQRQADLRPPGRRRGRLQPDKAGPPVARLPHLCDGRGPAGAGCRSHARQPAPRQSRPAGPDPAAGRMAPHERPYLVRGDAGLRQRAGDGGAGATRPGTTCSGCA